MIEISVNFKNEIPVNFTGKVNYIHEVNKGAFEYYQDGVFHREDGPAVYYPWAIERKYYLYGNFLSKIDWFNRLSKEDKIKSIWNADEWK